MRKIISFCIIIFLYCSVSWAQDNFKKGYLITENTQKIPCFIQKENWKNNPENVTYKIKEEDPLITVPLKDILEFGIEGQIKYIKAEVPVEKYSSDLKVLSKDKAPDFENKTVLLDVLLEGEYNLYSYINNGKKQFFYRKKGNLSYSSLVYKKYRNIKDQIEENNHYKNQLYSLLRCEGLDISTFNNLNYQKNDLIEIFEDYYKCNDTVYQFSKSITSDFNFSIKPGISLHNLSIESPQGLTNVDFNTQISFRIGIEAEIFFPTIKKNWSLFFEPNFQSLNVRQNFSNQVGINVIEDIAVADFSFINLPLGIRYYLIIGKKSNIFIDAGPTLYIPLSGGVTFEGAPDLETGLAIGGFLSLGYKYKKYSVALRLTTDRDIIDEGGDFFERTSSLTSFEFIVGYKLF